MATYSSIKQAVATAANVARVVATNYDSIGSLPTSGNVLGEQALVIGDSSTDRLYIWEGSAWYQVALIQNSPTFTTSPDSAYELATDGVTTTVITLAATDPEGFPITFSATTNVGFDSIATVSQDSSVFTVTPFSRDSAGVSRTGTITFKASDGISVASAISTFTITFDIENSNYTSTILKASGNNGTNTALNDASASNRSITLNGDISAQAFTPHHPGGYSAYFDGNQDYLTIPHDSGFDFGTGDFTVEGWWYPTGGPAVNSGASNRSTIIGTYNNGAGGFGVQYRFDTSEFNFFFADTPILTPSYTVVLNNWYHFAVVRNSGTLTFYINGVSIGSTSDSTNLTYTSQLWIGRINSTAGGGTITQEVQGYLSDIRIVKGTAVYTAEFTPPTERLTAITNTELLVCHLPYLADGSSNDHTATFAGNVAIKRFAPYDHVPYDPATHGTSVFNDGTGDYMTTPADTTDLTMSGDFTIDFWYYPTAAKNMGYVYGKWNNNSDGWALWVTPNYSSGNFGYVTFYYGNYGSNESATNLRSTVVTLNQWHYVRVTRSSGTMYMSVNGKVGTRTNYSSGITFTDNRTFNADATIGITGNSVGYTIGEAFVSDLRVINGTALTTGNFTPPTSPVTAVTNTKLLTCNDQPNIYSTNGGALTLTGNAKSSTAYTKNANSSIYLDGDDDVRITSYPEPIGTDDYTVEGWYYLTARNTSGGWLWQLQDGHAPSNAHGIQAYYRNSTFSYNWAHLTNNTQYNTSTASLLNQWQHVALARSSGITTMFVDGVPISTQTGDTYNAASYDDITLGKGYSNRAITGYVEDFRVTKGLSRYPFISPRKTLTAVTNTKLLACHATSATTDGSGESQTITANGTPLANQAGPFGGMKSVYFDGSNEALRTNDASSLSMGTEDFTIEAWIKPDNTSTAYRAIVSDNAYGTNSGSWCIYQYGTRLHVSANSGSGGQAISTLGGSGNTLLSAGTWSHIVFTRTSGTARLFHNGRQVGSDTSLSTDFTDDQILIGANNHAGGYPAYEFIGYISNVRVIKGTAIYNKTFTPPAAELKA